MNQPSIIVDCGATKADWMRVDSDELITTKGYNPNIGGGETFINSAQRALEAWLKDCNSATIHFYGSGQTEGHHNQTRQLLKVLFPNGNISVDHDLMAACRSTAKHNYGIVAILGTGMNSCLYNGTDIIDRFYSFGSYIGEYASGMDLGRKLLEKIALRMAPEEIVKDVFTIFPGEFAEIKKSLYQSERRNVFLASFAAYLIKYKETDFVQSLVEERIDGLISNQLSRYDAPTGTPVHFVGSIAHFFKPLLKKQLAEHGLHLGETIQKPIEHLKHYHLT